MEHLLILLRIERICLVGPGDPEIGECLVPSGTMHYACTAHMIVHTVELAARRGIVHEGTTVTRIPAR